jgi:peroxiredoxin
MKKKATRQPKAEKAHLLGVGLDNKDGHKRITTAEKFTIVGGSDETHGRMTETVIKTFEELKTRGKHLQTVEPKELAEIIHKSTPR